MSETSLFYVLAIMTGVYAGLAVHNKSAFWTGGAVYTALVSLHHLLKVVS